MRNGCDINRRHPLSLTIDAFATVRGLLLFGLPTLLLNALAILAIPLHRHMRVPRVGPVETGLLSY